MKLHATAIDKLLNLFDSFGGHRNESKLRSALTQVDLSTYDKVSGETILVMTSDLDSEKSKINQK